MLRKEIITIVISVVGFVISIFTAYYNFFRQTYQVSAVVTGAPPLGAVLSEIKISPRDATLVFINSGNRAVAILDVQIWLSQPRNDVTPDCTSSGYRGVLIGTTFQPMALKEKDVVSRNVGPVWLPTDQHLGVTKQDDGVFSFPVATENVGKEKFPILMCYRVTISTPSISHHVAYIEARRVDFRDTAKPGTPAPTKLLHRLELAIW